MVPNENKTRQKYTQHLDTLPVYEELNASIVSDATTGADALTGTVEIKPQTINGAIFGQQFGEHVQLLLQVDGGGIICLPAVPVVDEVQTRGNT